MAVKGLPTLPHQTPHTFGELTFASSEPWRKRTRVACNLELAGERHFCQRSEPHVVLRGRSIVHKMSWTAVAQPYPRGFAEALAAGASRRAGWESSRGKMNLVACAHCGSRRIGEAKNPRLRRRRVPRLGSLEAKLLQTEATLHYEDKLWKDSLSWCSSCLSDPLSLFLLCRPLLAAMAFRTFGDFFYTS